MSDYARVHLEGVKLLEQALFLQQNGERPPGAPPYPAETWHDWEIRTEAYLRSIDE